jgi:glycosyltransferase involved in cell wall biosynthesis
MPMVAVSIVTVVKNNAEGLASTLKSALVQDLSDWELIIVYSQSQDSTYEVASKFCNLDSRISLLEQQDQGIYEAMNLGISKSRADYLWFMNSGDRFFSENSLKSGFNAIKASGSGFLVGGYKIDNDQRLFQQSAGKLTQIKFALSRRGACHQAMIFRKESVLKARSFDTKFSLAADYQLCLKIIKDAGAGKLPGILALMEPDGLSDQNLSKMHKEKSIIRREIFSNNLPIRAIGWFWMKAARLKAITRRLANGKKHPLG